ncbi:MAG: hypothetical protein R2867_46380 [Caldilineaceae bacterium]
MPEDSARDSWVCKQLLPILENVTDTAFNEPVLEISELAIAYKVRGGEIEAVQNVSFPVDRGESHGIVR